MSAILTDAEQVRERFDYCADTGNLTWRIESHRTTKGVMAGTIAKSGYIRVRFMGRLHNAHRLCWLHYYGTWPNALIDHINGNCSDNRITNLREATVSQNKCNSRKRFNGVYWHKTNKRWCVAVAINGKLHHFGSFINKDSATRVAQCAIKELHGDFAKF